MSDVIPDQPPTGGGGGSGTVTSVSVTTANGVSGSVANATTTPALSLTLGDIVPTSLGVGTGATTLATKLHVADTSATTPRGLMSSQHSDDTGSAHLHMRKSRGTMASPTVVVTGDILGRAVFSGYDGANYLEMGSVRVTATGTIASTRVPTLMEFMTATDAAPSVLTSRMNIGPSGVVTMSANITSTSTTTGTLVVTGGVGISGTLYSAQNFSTNGYNKPSSWGIGGGYGVITWGNSDNGIPSQFVFGVSATTSAPSITRDSVNGFSITSGANSATFNDPSTANSGTVASRYLFGLAAPTLTSTGTSVTYTTASTVRIGGAPAASTNVTIGTPYALEVAAGNVIFGGVLAVGGAAVSASTALNHPAGTTALSSLRIPHGVAPTSPVNGDVWSTTTTLNFQLNGVTKSITLI